jgi:hypothetical protein
MTITEETVETLPPLPAWSIHWRGKVFHESELKGKHLSILFLLTGRDDLDMLELSPVGPEGVRHQRLMLIISAFIAGEAGASMTDADAVAEAIALARSEVADAPVEEILGSIRFE